MKYKLLRMSDSIIFHGFCFGKLNMSGDMLNKTPASAGNRHGSLSNTSYKPRLHFKESKSKLLK
jgi:hypothetical protein